MTADCWGCLTSQSAIPPQWFAAKCNDPLGACIDCSVFACGQHGERNNVRGKFQCYLCAPKQAVKGSATPAVTALVTGATDGVANLVTAYAVETFEEFQRLFPELLEWARSHERGPVGTLFEDRVRERDLLGVGLAMWHLLVQDCPVNLQIPRPIRALRNDVFV